MSKNVIHFARIFEKIQKDKKIVMMYKFFLKTICVMFLFSWGCYAGDIDNNAEREQITPSIDELVNLLETQLSQEQFDALVEKYKITISKGKLFQYKAKEFGFLFLASLGVPRQFSLLGLKVSENAYMKEYKIYNGSLPFNIKRDCTEEDIIKQLNLPKDSSGSGIKYEDSNTGLLYDFMFKGGKLEEIDIIKRSKETHTCIQKQKEK